MKRWIVLSTVLLLALPGLAGWQEGSSEFELFLGSHLGDNFTLESDYGDEYRMQLNDSLLLGMRGAYFFGPNTAIEFTLAGTQSDTRDGDDFDLYYYHGNILYQFGEAGFAPFVTVGMGLTTTRRPDVGYGDWDRITDSHFSWNFGGGFKVYFNRNFALRTDVRGYWTSMDDRDCDHYDNHDEDCWNNENILSTTEISAGFVFRF